MKEKIVKKGKARRLLSIVLALAMVLTLMPMNTMTVRAAAHEAQPESLLTTISSPEDNNYDYNFAPVYSVQGKATLEAEFPWQNNAAYGGFDIYGNFFEPGSYPLEVKAASGYTITKVEFVLGRYGEMVVTDTQAPFVLYEGRKYNYEQLKVSLNSNLSDVIAEGNSWESHVKEVKVYGHPTRTTCVLEEKVGYTACTEYGWKNYYQCTDCKVIFPADDQNGVGYADLEAWKNSEEGKIAPLGHKWGYSAEGAVMTATCLRDGCTVAPVSMTLSATTGVLPTGAETVDVSTLLAGNNWDDFNATTGLNLSSSDIVIYKYDDNVIGDKVTDSALSTGKYLAELRPTVSNGKVSTDDLGEPTRWSYNGKEYFVYNEMIPKSIDSSWNDATEFVAALNNAKYQGCSDWMLLADVDMAKDWASKYGSADYGAIERLWMTNEVEDDPNWVYYYVFKGKRPGLGSGWKTDHSDWYSFVVCREATGDFPKPTVAFRVKPEHNHSSFTYTASGDTLTATCGLADCYLPNNQLSFKLLTNATNYTGKPATVCADNSNDKATVIYNSVYWTDEGAGDVILKYVGRGDTTYSESTTPPTKIGTYTVKLYSASEEGNPTNVITADFEITKASKPAGYDKVIDLSSTDWEYTIYANGTYKSNVTGDESGTFSAISLYNISGSDVTYSGATVDDTLDAAYSSNINSTTINSLLSDLSVTDGVGFVCSYSAATNTVAMTPIVHHHTWNYSVSDTTITAKSTCHEDADCDFKPVGEKTVSLTLTAKDAASSNVAYAATLSSTTEWTKARLSVPAIKYYKATSEGGTEGTEEVTQLAGLAAGNYYATMTVGTAVVKTPFKIYSEHTHDGISFDKVLTSAGGTLTDGNYILTEDVTLNANLVINGNVNICLNGHVLKGTGTANVIIINSGKTLNLYDCDTETEHRGTLSDDGYFWTWDGGTDTGDTVIKGGIITGGGCTDKTNAAGVTVTGTFNMYGGTIAGNNNSRMHGGAVRVAGTFNMNGGAIKYNKAVSQSGGIFVNAGGKFIMNDGVISYNLAGNGGGAVYTTGTGTFTMNNGEISNNRANGSQGGGGVRIESANCFTMNGGTIKNNTTAYNGGGVRGSIVMNGGTITGNTAASGAGVYGDGAVTIGGTATITGNKIANGTVQNLYLPSSKVITLKNPTTAKIGITTQTVPTETTPVAITGESATDYSLILVPDDSINYAVKYNSSKQLELVIETGRHAWVYSVNDNVLTAKCKGKANGCTRSVCGHDTDETVVKLTLTASGEGCLGSTVDDAKSTIFANTNFEDFNSITGNSVSINDIKIYRYDNDTKGAEVTGNFTTTGKYLAELSASGGSGASSTPIVYEMKDEMGFFVNGTISTADLGTPSSWTYDGKTYDVFNEFIKYTSNASWNNAMGFVAALNAAEYGGHNDWTLLSSEEMARAWYNQFSSICGYDVTDFWSSVEASDMQAYKFFWPLNQWKEYYKDTSSSSYGFVVLRGADVPIPTVTTTFDVTQSHVHGSWTYEVDGNTLTAICGASGEDVAACGLENNRITLALTVSGENYSGIRGLNAFNAATGLSVSENDVEIYKVDAADTTEGGAKVTETPLADGYYYASLTVGDNTIVKAFKVGNPVPEKAEGPESPVNLVPYRPTTFGGSDGKILGVDETMEYSTDAGETWTDVSGTAITGLEPGTVLVRVKETETTKAGASVSVVVLLHRELIFVEEFNQWRLYVGDEFQEQITGFVYQDEFFYVENGIYNKAYLGLADYEGTLWYAKNGRLDKSFTGLADYQGTKIFTRNGKASYETGIYVDGDGVSYYIVDGLIDTTKTGLFYDGKASTWKYFVEGVQAKASKGLVWHGNAWYYVANGVLDKSYAGLVWHGNAWYYVSGGKLDKSYAGLTQYGGKLWYVSDGKLNKEFAGDVEYKGAEYTVANGIGTAK